MADEQSKREDLEEVVRVAQSREKTARNHLNAAIEANRQNPAQGKTLAARQTEDRLTREYRAAQQETKVAEFKLQAFDRNRQLKKRSLKDPKQAAKDAEKSGKGFKRRRDRDDEFER